MLAIIYSCYYKHVLQYQFIYSVISSFQLSHQAIYQLIHYLLNELKQKKLWLLSLHLKTQTQNSTQLEDVTTCFALIFESLANKKVVLSSRLRSRCLGKVIWTSPLLPPPSSLPTLAFYWCQNGTFFSKCFFSIVLSKIVHVCHSFEVKSVPMVYWKKLNGKKIDKKKKRKNNKNTMPKTNHQGDGRLYC